MYQLPPAGGYPSILRFLNQRSKSLELNTTLKQQFKQEVYLTNSGKSALLAVLLAQSKLRKSDQVKRVLIPNYCCPDLVFAINKAGLQTVLAPVKKYTLEIDQEFYKNLDSKDYLAIILPNLYGMLDSIPESIDPDILIIDDLCLSLRNIKETRADVSVFSAGRGKTICGFGGGGVIVKNSELGKEVEKIISGFDKPSFIRDLKILAYATLIPILENPYLFFLLNKMVKTGEVKINFEFEAGQISKFEEEYASFQNKRAQNIKETRVVDWSKEIKSKSIIHPYLEREKLERQEISSKNLNPPVFSRYPVILEQLDNKALSRLKRWGINASYQKPLSEYEQLKSFVIYDSKKDQDFLKRIVTLPTHSKVKKEDVGEILRIIV